MTSSVIYVGNDSRIVLKGLKDRAGALISAATVTLVNFVDRFNKTVNGITLPGQLNNTSGGDYELLVPRTIAVQAGKQYYATVRAEFSGLRGEWRETIDCKVRQE